MYTIRRMISDLRNEGLLPPSGKPDGGNNRPIAVFCLPFIGFYWLHLLKTPFANTCHTRVFLRLPADDGICRNLRRATILCALFRNGIAASGDDEGQSCQLADSSHLPESLPLGCWCPASFFLLAAFISRKKARKQGLCTSVKHVQRGVKRRASLGNIILLSKRNSLAQCCPEGGA